MKGRINTYSVTQKSFRQILRSTKSLLPPIGCLSTHTDTENNQKQFITSSYDNPSGPQKSFIFDSEDDYIRKALVKHGWIECNSNSKRPVQLIWAYNQDKLSPSLILKANLINHFKTSHFLTTKEGLRTTLYRNAPSDFKVSGFYPRSYDLHSELSEFIADFDRTAMMNLLRKYIVCAQLHYGCPIDELAPNIKRMNFLDFMKSQKFQQKIDPEFIINKKLLLYSIVVFENIKNTLDVYEKNREDENSYWLQVPDSIFEELIQFSMIDPPYSLEAHQELKQWGTPNINCLLLLKSYSKLFERKFPHYRNDGFGNIWIVKPSESSKGRNLQLICFKQDIRRHIQSNKIIQKYIENIWIFTEKQLTHYNEEQVPVDLKYLLNRKFDIRLWVLVTSFEPLEVYIFSQGYLRITSLDYAFNNLSNVREHLTNYSINKHHTKDDQSFVLLSSLQKHLRKVYSQNSLFSDIEDLIIRTLACTHIQHSQKSFELFGFDVILDCDLKPWLLEVNMSPACRERGQLQQIVKCMGEGLLRILNLIPNQDQNTKPPYHWIKILGNQPYQDAKVQTRVQLNVLGFNISQRQLQQNQNNFHVLSAVYSIQRFFRVRFQHNLSRTQKIQSRTKSLIGTLSKALCLLFTRLQQVGFRRIKNKLSSGRAVRIRQSKKQKKIYR